MAPRLASAPSMAGHGAPVRPGGVGLQRHAQPRPHVGQPGPHRRRAPPPGGSPRRSRPPRAGSSSMRTISRRTHSSKAARISELSGSMRASSVLTCAITRCATAAPTAQPTSRPPCSRTRSSMALLQRPLAAGQHGRFRLASRKLNTSWCRPPSTSLAQRAADHPARRRRRPACAARCRASSRRARPSSMLASRRGSSAASASAAGRVAAGSARKRRRMPGQVELRRGSAQPRRG